jgi:transposase
MRGHVDSSFARIALADHRADAASRSAQAERWSAACSGTRCVSRYPFRPSHGHPVGDASGRDGVRIGRDLLAAAARLANGRGVGPPTSRTAAPVARRGPDRLGPGLHGQFFNRGQKGGAATGPNPTDRGRLGTKRHLITDRHGIPLAFLLTGANVHDSVPFEELLDAVPPVAGKRGQPRRRPDKLHADKAYDHQRCRRACLRRRIKPRIARRGRETSQKLGRHRWVIERSFAWLNKFRRLTIRYERRLDMHHAFTSLACSLICLRALAGRF